MNEPLPQFLSAGQEVLVVGHDRKTHRARITEVFHSQSRAVRVESLDGKNTAVSEYSETGEVNTFHFPPSTSASGGKAENKTEAKS